MTVALDADTLNLQDGRDQGGGAMDPTAILGAARSALDEDFARIAEVLRRVPDLDVPVANTRWTVRETAAHFVNYLDIYTGLAQGQPSPIQIPPDPLTGFPWDGARYRDRIAEESETRIAQLTERDPAKLTQLVLDATARFLDATSGRAGDETVSFHCGVPATLADLACIYLGEPILHGYDIATTAGVPWPIDPAHVALVLGGYAPYFGLVANRDVTAGLTVAYEIDLRGLARSVVGFVDGDYFVEPPGSRPVDCKISADPVAYLLVGARRLDPWAAIALGLLSAGGPRPELALSFGELFIYP